MTTGKMKKLLILGASIRENVIIRHARKLGIYTIVTDYHEDWSLSPAKYAADEAWNISWSEIDTLAAKCAEEHISGILAGFSEFRIQRLIDLCAATHLPCYLTSWHLHVTRDKLAFKQLCREYDVPTVPEFQKDDVLAPADFPVIVKPVDQAGSIGMSVANNEEELRHSIDYALSLSESGKMVIERFCDNSYIKFDVFYVIHQGVPYLIGTNDTVMCQGKKGYGTLQKAWLFPSIYEKEYMKECEGKVRNMLCGMNIDYGYITMSSFYKDHHFWFFECGFRLSGEHSYNFAEEACGINYVDYLIRRAIGDEVTDFSFHPHNERIKMVVLNFFGIQGVVSSIQGLEHIGEIPEVKEVCLYTGEGKEIETPTEILPKVAMISLFSEDPERLRQCIDEVNGSFDIVDAQGNSLIYERTLPEEILL